MDAGAATTVASATVVQLSFGELITVVMCVLAGFLAMAKLIVSQTKAAIESKQNSLEESIAGLQVSVAQLEKEVESNNRLLPIEYVRREDWIRMSASIDGKFDRLAQMIIDLKGVK